ncbi:mismatch-specific DNA-glycosylase [Asticcacaulis sp. AND118]|uniref:mismatch-specific DNA-glycosylase n=1 Tax=Asticcacaulis sp. AND118 TaxID=2840468 RepID=UPI001CFF8C1E|nr:mismatch-specific DNA-glycosylase [Asticcacaulis sp. AND118]UDF04548.1 mismatch-specific DNA-glycosylase [Asticcacaulis sp. AND118]
MTALERSGVLPESHLVPDLLRPGLKLVFCGTALGRVSAERRAYYAHPGNFFWRTLHSVGLTPVRIAPADYPRLLDFGIGLTDLCKAHYGNDVDLPPEAWDAEALRARIAVNAPRHLAFTSKTAASVFLGRPTGQIALGLQPETAGATALWVLPSPSGQARRFWDETVWRDLARAVSASPAPSAV